MLAHLGREVIGAATRLARGVSPTQADRVFDACWVLRFAQDDKENAAWMTGVSRRRHSVPLSPSFWPKGRIHRLSEAGQHWCGVEHVVAGSGRPKRTGAILARGPGWPVASGADAALLEVVFVLERGHHTTRPVVAEALRSLLAQPAFSFDRALWTRLIPIYETHPKLSCTDIFLSLDAERHDALPLLTFDKKLVTQLGAVDPGDMLGDDR